MAEPMPHCQLEIHMLGNYCFKVLDIFVLSPCPSVENEALAYVSHKCYFVPTEV